MSTAPRTDYRVLARVYHDDLGFNVLPVGRDKVSLVKWERWETEQQSPQIVGSLPFRGALGVAAVNGAVSAPEGLCLINVDADRAPGESVLLNLLGQMGLPKRYPWAIYTPGKGGGWHVWVYAAESDLRGELAKKGLDSGRLEAPFPGADHIELRWNAAYTVLPGSIHPEGGVYSWVNGNGTPPSEPPATVPAGRVVRLGKWAGATEDGTKAPAKPLVEKIAEGAGRHPALASFAGSMRRRGAEADEILAALRPLNNRICAVLVPDADLLHIATSMMKYAPTDPINKMVVVWDSKSDGGVEQRENKPIATTCDCSDDGNAQRLIRKYGDRVRYLPGEEKWLIWDGRRWKRDDAHQIENLAAEALRAIHHEAGDAPTETLQKRLGAWAITSGQAQRRTGALLCARSEPAVVVRREDLDRDPYLLNILNGTIDLHTGELRSHRQADALTWLAPVEFRGLHVRDEVFEKALHDATGGDKEFQRWMQRYAGMSLVGEMTELVLILLGGTETGKSTLTGALTATLGEGNYALTGNQDALLRNPRNVGGPRGSVMAFEGRRLVAIPEFDSTKTLDEPLIKTLTGEKTFQGRALWENDHGFQPISKLWLHTNHMPKVSVEDPSLWRRLRVAPFVCRPAQIDETIKPYLTDPEHAGPAILAWALRGCLDWQAAGGGKDGLGTCAVVDRATAALRIRMDPLADFFEECCVFEPDAFAVTADIRTAYGAWAELNNVPKNQRCGDKVRATGLRLRGASDQGRDGFGVVEGQKVRGWTGVRLVDLAQGSLL